MCCNCRHCRQPIWRTLPWMQSSTMKNCECERRQGEPSRTAPLFAQSRQYKCPDCCPPSQFPPHLPSSNLLVESNSLHSEVVIARKYCAFQVKATSKDSPFATSHDIRRCNALDCALSEAALDSSKVETPWLADSATHMCKELGLRWMKFRCNLP